MIYLKKQGRQDLQLEVFRPCSVKRFDLGREVRREVWSPAWQWLNSSEAQCEDWALGQQVLVPGVLEYRPDSPKHLPSPTHPQQKL